MNLKYADARREEGFTLIELLVVVIIIGILAAIAIPVFLNQRTRAWNSAVESDLRNAAIAQETYATDNNGQYASEASQLTPLGFNESEPVTLTVESDGGTSYCMSASHEADPSGTQHRLDSSVGAPEQGESC